VGGPRRRGEEGGGREAVDGSRGQRRLSLFCVPCGGAGVWGRGGSLERGDTYLKLKWFISN